VNVTRLDLVVNGSETPKPVVRGIDAGGRHTSSRNATLKNAGTPIREAKLTPS